MGCELNCKRCYCSLKHMGEDQGEGFSTVDYPFLPQMSGKSRISRELAIKIARERRGGSSANLGCSVPGIINTDRQSQLNRFKVDYLNTAEELRKTLEKLGLDKK